MINFKLLVCALFGHEISSTTERKIFDHVLESEEKCDRCGLSKVDKSGYNINTMPPQVAKYIKDGGRV